MRLKVAYADRARDGRRAANERGPPVAAQQLLRNVLLSASARLGGVTVCLVEASTTTGIAISHFAIVESKTCS